MRYLLAGAAAILIAGAALTAGAQSITGNLGSLEEAEGACKGNIAFPGARGYGKCATGWRGGRIVFVTNTNDSGAGSFRQECVEADGPRVCIFKVGGTIENLSGLIAGGTGQNEGGNVYIAGQSAPADSGGIQVRLTSAGPNLSTINFAQVDHVLVRHMRFRPGQGNPAAIGDSISGILLRNVRHAMIANNSIQYASDQNITTTADQFGGIAPIRGITRYVTFQRNISAYALLNANHSTGAHSKAALYCAANLVDLQNGDRCDHTSIIEDVYATSNDRMPELSAGSGGPYHVANVLTYNASSTFFEMDADNFPGAKVDILGSRAKEGPETRDVSPPTLFFCRDDLGNGSAGCDVFSFGNLSEDQRPTILSGAESTVFEATATINLVNDPSEPRLAGPMINPERLEDVLLPLVGATAPARDALDSRVIDEIINRTGSIPDDPTDIVGAGLTGGYPTLATGTLEVDTDNDGMPDFYERAVFGEFFVTEFNPWGDNDGNGWSNLEDFLNCRAGDIPGPCFP